MPMINFDVFSFVLWSIDLWRNTKVKNRANSRPVDGRRGRAVSARATMPTDITRILSRSFLFLFAATAHSFFLYILFAVHKVPSYPRAFSLLKPSDITILGHIDQ